MKMDNQIYEIIILILISYIIIGGSHKNSIIRRQNKYIDNMSRAIQIMREDLVSYNLLLKQAYELTKGENNDKKESKENIIKKGIH